LLDWNFTKFVMDRRRIISTSLSGGGHVAKMHSTSDISSDSENFHERKKISSANNSDACIDMDEIPRISYPPDAGPDYFNPILSVKLARANAALNHPVVLHEYLSYIKYSFWTPFGSYDFLPYFGAKNQFVSPSILAKYGLAVELWFKTMVSIYIQDVDLLLFISLEIFCMVIFCIACDFDFSNFFILFKQPKYIGLV